MTEYKYKKYLKREQMGIHIYDLEVTSNESVSEEETN